MKGLYSRMTLLMLRELAFARKAGGSIGPKAFEFKSSHQEDIRDFLIYFASAR